MKSEPEVYSIRDLEREGRTCWDGIRNYQARNFMRDEMEKGDLVLFYHSSARPVGVAGIAEVVREAYPDYTAWDPSSEYYDARSTPEKPLWLMVDIQFRRKLPRLVTLDEIRADPILQNMVLVQNSRLSVQPVSPEEFERIVTMAEERPV